MRNRNLDWKLKHYKSERKRLSNHIKFMYSRDDGLFERTANRIGNLLYAISLIEKMKGIA
jgi:hypothetical protein